MKRALESQSLRSKEDHVTTIPNPQPVPPKTEIPKVETPAAAPDPFDLNQLRVPIDYEADAGVRKLLTTVPARRPHRQEWIWVHPGEDYRETFMCVELKEENEIYLCFPHVARELPGEIGQRMLYTVQNASRVTFLWPVKVAAPGERLDSWSTSAHEAAAKAMTERIRLSANRGLGAYEIMTTQSQPIGFEPKWPEASFQELVKLAFRGGRLIENFDHPVIRQLRGL
jgi:hypothetical protein